MNAALEVKHHDENLTEELRGRICVAGRNSGPWLLQEACLLGQVDDDALRSLLLDVWSGVEFPLRAMSRKKWLQWFEATGFLSDDGAKPPTAPVEVWRAQVGKVVGLSWTANRDTALWFNRRNELFGFDGVLLHAVAEPRNVLARIVLARNEHEVIVHPRQARVIV